MGLPRPAAPTARPTCTPPNESFGKGIKKESALLVQVRLQGIAAGHLVKEHGCGQKGQVAPEHLRAFMDLMVEGVQGVVSKGEVDGDGETPRE